MRHRSAASRGDDRELFALREHCEEFARLLRQSGAMSAPPRSPRATGARFPSENRRSGRPLTWFHERPA
jgi:hypothetical protein